MRLILTKSKKAIELPAWPIHLRTTRVYLGIVLLAAALLRLYGLNWDINRHLHPDERFLTRVTYDLSWPNTLDAYFDPQVSTLSPYSLPEMGLYVYGTLPVYIVKWAAIQFNQTTYDQIPLVGRVLSGFFDLGAVFFLFLIGRRLYGETVGLLAAMLLSFSVLNIQLSHFYTVDTFANLFVVATFYFLLRACMDGRWGDYALTGLFFGLGLSSKISIFPLVVPILLAAGIDFYRRARTGASLSDTVERSLVRLFTVLGLAALTFRLVQPIAFTGPTFWNWSLNPEWYSDVMEQAQIVAGLADLPWLQQWTGRSVEFVLVNLVVWGLGIPLGLTAIAGLGLAGYELVRQRKIAHFLPVVYVIVTFAYHAATFVKFMRYFLPIYPFLVLLAAYLLVQAGRYAVRQEPAAGEVVEPIPQDHRKPLAFLAQARAQFLIFAGVVIGGTLLYALAFSAIYSRPHSRIAASRWLYANIPAGSTLANEHWDDWLPIGGMDGKTAYGEQGLFQAVEMPLYEPETPEKLDLLVKNLSQADYLILSSNRLYDSIPRLPARYPMTSRYYELLFTGELGFQRIAEFTSYPSLLGFQIPDQWAEESFTVYDHPRVQIYQKTPAFNTDAIRARLNRGIEWDMVLHLTPRQASAAPTGLRLLPAEQQRYQQAAESSSAGVSETSWGSRVPVLAWALMLLACGLLAAPITLVVFQPFVDRGYFFSKAIGLLMVAWMAWLIASLRLIPFGAGLVLGAMFVLGVVSGLVWRANRTTLMAFFRARWRILLLEEGLFWAFFALMLLIRLGNPDLWHPSLGGEKPMDLAYLTAIVRTPYFPPYDPWFSGGYINYYYFGYVLVAVLSHLTGIIPVVAYNLAVPMFFALTAIGAFGVSLNLAEGWRNAQPPETRRWQGSEGESLLAGVCGALFVTLLGNLGQVQLLFDAFRNLSVIKVEGNPSLVVMLAQFADGVGQWVQGQPLALRTEWWYWNATRIIPPGAGEAGPINEMPFFTFLYGDLHAHMMALPFTLLALGLVLNLLFSAPGSTPNERQAVSWRGWHELVTLILLGFTIGALRVMNTWDFPTYILLAAGGLMLLAYARRGQFDLGLAWDMLWRMALVLLIGQVLFMPFHQTYASDYFGAQLWHGSRTPLWAYLLIHGFFLFLVASYLAAELLGGGGHNRMVRMLRYFLEHGRRPRRVRSLFARLIHQIPSSRGMVVAGLAALALLVVVFVLDRVAGTALALILLALLLLSGRPAPRRQFVLLLILLGLILTVLVEFVVLKGDISRMNTVFKFYLQVWVLWGIAAASVFPQLVAKLRAAAKARRKLLGGWEPRDWWIAFGALLAACLLYPLTAAPMRIQNRVEGSSSFTLDGSAYMQAASYIDQEQRFSLEGDRQALAWLRQNVRGLPVIVEANTPIYRWGSRVSIYTGLPAIIGWDWHQKQQRSILPGDIIDRRVEDVRAIYSTSSLEETVRLLDRYHVRYIYSGPLERIYYGDEAMEKFEQFEGQFWHRVYQNEQVTIYEVMAR